MPKPLCATRTRQECKNQEYTEACHVAGLFLAGKNTCQVDNGRQTGNSFQVSSGITKSV
jgi:hypothetical protein